MGVRAARPGRFARLTSEANGMCCWSGENRTSICKARPGARGSSTHHERQRENAYIDDLCGGWPRPYFRSEAGDLLQVESQLTPSSLFKFLRRVSPASS